MSQDQDQTDTPTEAPSDEAETQASDDSPAEDGEAEDGSDDSDDDAKAKKKPKKIKINYEAAMPRSEAVSYFEAIIGGLRSGRLEFRQEGETLVLSPPDQLEIEVKAQRKGDKAKVVFEIEWSDTSESLEILN